MEVDEGSSSGGGGEGGGGGVGVGESVGTAKKNSAEGEAKVKRKMKTPSQLEVLEKTYAIETYPSEALRAELSVKLGLTDRQLQMWFCHRRLKDRKPSAEKRQKKSTITSAVAEFSSGTVPEKVVSSSDVANDSRSGLNLFGNMEQQQQQQQQQQRVAHKAGTAVPRISTELPSMRRYYEPPLAISEQRAIKFVEAQLGEPLRDDGPILGMEFDPLPPGAFGAPIVTSDQQKRAGRSYDAHLYERLDAKPIKGASRVVHEYQFLPEKPSTRTDPYERVPHYYGSPPDVLNSRVPLPTGRPVIRSNEQGASGYLQGQMPSLSLLPQQGRQEAHLSPAPGEVDVGPLTAPVVNTNVDSQLFVHPGSVFDNQITTPERRTVLDPERLERKRKAEEARIAKEVEAHEKRIRKELEKQDILRRKKEEQMRKEMERQDRERRKEEERLLREKQREEERCQREQRREMERREKFLQKEYIKAEKMRLKEEMRREKEAARLKAANNRAAARRIAKESMELVEDERLELMEIAALNRGLPSILALDSETLQNLDLLKDKLPEFPPKSVHLKKPFHVQPWSDSEENLGNLLMVWRFLISFADVLGLWPFTLDEFIQALHDTDPRLLGEIHIALLRSIIKDIGDVGRASDPNSAGIPVGGHPHIVEGAYAWGFDLLSWQRHLNPLTWPEVLRQFALSADFGPKLRNSDIKPACFQNDSEGDNGADTISNIRSGVAAENAVSIMQERGFSNSRRSRHRLTPGTVKFAAFHILSLEGSKGLSILEVADKIQRSGLRDLTTSKTPEASISAALSRDTKLFERTAPSTYCVRSPYRKDPDDAEALLSEARERIRVYQNGDVDEEEPDVEKDDLERDQDSESDIGDDPDVDDLDALAKLKESSHSSETSKFEDISGYGNDNSCSELLGTAILKSSSMLTESANEMKDNGTMAVSCVDASGANSQVSAYDLEDNVVDESGPGEPWVQGLTEGEYADLSTEERLNALVALIGVANEGNAIRVALEERLEAANALKKQMWAEAQLDKRRMKEEHIFKSHRAEHVPHGIENRRSPLNIVPMKKESSSANPEFQLVDLNDQQNEEHYINNIATEKNPLMEEFSVVPDNLMLQQSVYAAEKSRSELKAFISHRAEEIYVYRSLPLGQDRRRNRYWQFVASLSRNDPGSGRIFIELPNGVWRLIDSEEGFDALLSSLDVRGTRESHLHSVLQSIGPTFKETARKKSSCLLSGGHDLVDVKKEVKLDSCFRIYSPKGLSYASCSPGPSMPLAANLVNNGAEENDINQRYKDFEWIWKECFASNVFRALKHGSLRQPQLLEICNCCHVLFSWEENHCPFCHRTYSTSKETLNFAEHVAKCRMNQSEEFDDIVFDISLPPRIVLLKVQLATIEASIPSDALESFWSDEYRKSWGRKLHMSLMAKELLQCLTLLEDSIKREFLSVNYETSSEILSSSKVVGCSSRPGVVPIPPWMPLTAPAVALRLMDLDASIYYTYEHEETCQKNGEDGYFNNFSSSYSAFGCSVDNPSQAGSSRLDNCWVDLRNGRSVLKRGRGRPKGPSRTRGGKFQSRAVNAREEPCNANARKDKFTQLPGWRGRTRARGRGSKKGRRSIRSRQKPAPRAIGSVLNKRGGKGIVHDDDTAEVHQEEWNLAATPVEIEGAGNVSSSERSEFDNDNENDNGRASADEFDDLYADGFSGAGSRNFTESVDYGKGDEHGEDADDVDYDDDEYNDEEDDDGVDEREDYFAEGYVNSDYQEEEGNPTAGRERVQNAAGSSDGDSPSSSSSSEYSY
ncbi:homeobox-DDT domain protein RLT2 isoform X2 [Salvia miltiorrhiza]|uniref:homeobox-DDT domain protein RLT2 isoform X2 n=1 Tax=Salvia miltiorrhiza TaxID=226208 RepID=UPI0025AC3546|nr:homeobox-DDT domain protein RLT2 isoform X2 [Salvia miltiorrhiza]